MKSILTAGVVSAMVVTSARAHQGPRVWVDVDASGQIITLKGPPGGLGAGNYSAGQFTRAGGRVFVRDLGDTTFAGVPDNFAADFPGYERTPFPATSFSGTFAFDITGEVLKYQPAAFIPVSEAHPTNTPYFTVEGTAGAVAVSSTGFVAGSEAFTAGSHGHPLMSLQYVDRPTFGSDEFDGVYALPLRLRQEGLIASETFYLLLGRNASSDTLAAAETLANASLVPEPMVFAPIILSALGLLTRRRSMQITAKNANQRHTHQDDPKDA